MIHIVNIIVGQDNTSFDSTVYQFSSPEMWLRSLLLDKPAPVLTKVHYTTSNEIGLKLRYSSDIIESLTITYKSKQNSLVNEIHISPPSPTIQLTNLSCGNTYEIVVLAKNQAGFSISDSVIGKTDGSSKNVSIESNKLKFTFL